MVLEGLRAELDPLWQARRADCVVLHLADHAYRHIDLTRGTPVSGFMKMDDPHWWVTSLGSDSAVAIALTEMLLQHTSELSRDTWLERHDKRMHEPPMLKVAAFVSPEVPQFD